MSTKEKEHEINIGSKWRKWDLHVHSPASYNFEGDYSQFEKQLQKANCEVIGINDYFSVDGYKKIKEKIDEGNLDIGSKKIFPIVEFRMTECLQNKHNKTKGVTHFNFHIIFNDEIKIADIENLIKRQPIGNKKISEDYNDKDKLKDKKISLDKLLKDLIEDDTFKDKFLLWLPYDEYGGIDEIDPCSDGWIKQNYIEKSHIIGSSNKKQIDFFLWKSPKYKPNDFQKWFSRKKPCIKGSDSHDHEYPLGKLKDEKSKEIEKYCWIKADTTFEGLRQIIYEPETRVFIGEYPQIKPINTINSFKLSIPDDIKFDDGSTSTPFCFVNLNKSYGLSPYFNCFIGGRGTGKSTILNFFGLHSINKKNSEDFVKKLSLKNKPINHEEHFSLEQTSSQFEFLAQNEIEKFATQKKEFTKAILSRINSSDGKLNIYIKEYQSLKSGIETIRDSYNKLKQLRLNKEDYEKKETSLQKTIQILNSDKYTSLNKKIQDETKKLNILKKDKENVDKIRDNLYKLIGIKTEKEPEKQSKNNLYIKQYSLAMTKIEEAAELLEESNFEEEKQKENDINKKLSDLEGELKELIKDIGYDDENVEQIKSAPQKIITLQNEIKDLDDKIKENEKIINNFDDTVKNMKQNQKDYEDKINKELKPLQELLDNSCKDSQDVKKISFEYSFDEETSWDNLLEEVFNYFKNEITTKSKMTDFINYIKPKKENFSSNFSNEIIKDNNEKNNSEYMKFINNIFQDKNNFQLFQTIRDKHLYDVEKYNIIQVKYDNNDITRSSFGQKCTAVIVILLLIGNNPLILDEPEAHLDSSIISNYLVPLIKQKKLQRQIIFATHNANFVINGDAEKIFILKNESGKTEIIETTIENTKNRKDLLKLEGGKEAFSQRREKLNIK